jgi:hypothetical protein
MMDKVQNPSNSRVLYTTVKTLQNLLTKITDDTVMTHAELQTKKVSCILGSLLNKRSTGKKFNRTNQTQD